MADESKTLLFVDDEQSILTSLRRLLRKEDWNLLFADSGANGLEILKEHQVDLVVSDLRMPGMDGMVFLKQVKDLYPHIVRIILSGYADQEMVTQALSEEYAHQILPKPWEEEDVKEVIRNALNQSEKQKRQRLQQIINSLPSLPTLPQIYLKISEILEDSSNRSTDRIVEVIQRDPSISARLLHCANSAFFGQMYQVDTVKKAVVVLGMQIVEALVLSMSVFDSLSSGTPEVPRFNRKAFWMHSIGCGIVAKLTVEEASMDQNIANRAFTAGLLHDLGKLVEDQYLHDQFEKAIGIAHQKKVLLQQAEQEVMGTTHTEIGAYLGKWWSLPSFLVNAIRWHHTAHLCDEDHEVVAAVHVADVLVHQLEIGASGNFCSPSANAESWSRFGLSEDWLSSTQAIVERSIERIR